MGQDAFIFGGVGSSGEVAGTEVHAISIPHDGSSTAGYDYKCIPAVPDNSSGLVPRARRKHSAVVHEKRILVFGGEDDDSVLEEFGRVWAFDTEGCKWSYMDPALESTYPEPRSDRDGVLHNSTLVVCGKFGADGNASFPTPNYFL